MHQAKTPLSPLPAKAEDGEEVGIAGRGEPVVRSKPHSKRRFGAMEDQIDVDDGFFDPLPEEELAAWERR